MDTVYLLAYDVAHTEESLILDFWWPALQGQARWGLDDVEVSFTQ
jgi:hypothetical protein